MLPFVHRRHKYIKYFHEQMHVLCVVNITTLDKDLNNVEFNKNLFKYFFIFIYVGNNSVKGF